MQAQEHRHRHRIPKTDTRVSSVGVWCRVVFAPRSFKAGTRKHTQEQVSRFELRNGADWMEHTRFVWRMSRFWTNMSSNGCLKCAWTDIRRCHNTLSRVFRIPREWKKQKGKRDKKDKKDKKVRIIRKKRHQKKHKEKQERHRKARKGRKAMKERQERKGKEREAKKIEVKVSKERTKT